jgi:hypothetical protein
MNHLPFYIPVVFTAAVIFGLYILYKATRSYSVILIAIGWLLLQAIVALTGFYTDTSALPPRMILLVMPPMILIVVLFVTKKGRSFIQSIKLEWLVLASIIRLPVEFVLLWLAIQGVVPYLMTFEGSNFDIISGITAPLVWYFMFYKKHFNRSIFIAWNLLCIGLLLNVVIRALLSVPTPFQKFAFSQPNIGILYYPYVWLPGFLVPLVLFAGLVGIWKANKTADRVKIETKDSCMDLYAEVS